MNEMPIIQKHSKGDLEQMQSLPLSSKITMTKQRIIAWYEYFDGKVYVSFSGGKDSTVLLHLVRSLYPDVEAVFSDTGLEYPEIREFVKTFDNVTWLKPSMNFRQVITTYGYPVASKEVARKIHYAKKGSKWAKKYVDGSAVDSEGRPSRYRVSDRWLKLLDPECDFEVTAYCCDVMKKQVIRRYEKESGKVPYIGTLASESAVRSHAWERTGCNAFEANHPHSNPLSFWTENDILTYLLTYKIPYCSVYGDIVETGKTISGLCSDVPELKTTGCDRTGCMFCLFGIQCEKEPNRIQRMKETHPKQYEYMLKPIEEGGLGMKHVLDYIGIKYE